jgi:hypothetical protein
LHRLGILIVPALRSKTASEARTTLLALERFSGIGIAVVVILGAHWDHQQLKINSEAAASNVFIALTDVRRA